MAKPHLLSLLFIILSSALLVSCQDYNELVFSGFVELAPTATSDEVIDFSKVEIQLLTSDGKFVDKTFCSQNGFFLLPVNGKHAYDIKVRPPQESTFDPEVISVDLRGKSNEEVAKITETSLSFKFVGFSLTGDVKVEGSQQSASGVKVALYDSKNQRVAETTTQEGGRFRFDRVMTGKYRVELDSKDSGFSWRQGEGSLTCEVSWKNGQDCKGKLVISGFQVTGTIPNQNNILGNHLVFLYNEDASVKSKSTLPAVADHPLAAKKHDYVSYSRIDQDGKFKFENVPKGKYFLKVHTTDKTNNIEVEPEAYNFEVDASPVEVENRFAINKFSIKGRVVDHDKNGIAGIKIILDGQVKATSDSKGYYVIERVPVGTYTLEGHHEHLFFEPAANLELQPTLASLPDLVLSSVHLCGEVSLKGGLNDDEFRNAKILVYLEKQGEKRSATVDPNGHYCFEVQPGRYNIYPIISNVPAVRQESLLYPKQREVQITNGPVLDVNFFRPRLFIEGEVRLLANVKASQVEKTRIILTSVDGHQKAVPLNKNKFAFDQILPGSYRISIENPNLCWKNEEQRVELTNGNVTNLAFEQAGFALKYQTSRPLEVRIVSPDGKATETKLEPSTNSYCVDAAGSYKIIPDTCYQFKESEFNVNTNDESAIVLEPIGFLVRGEVIASDKIVPTTNDTFVQFVVENIHISLTVDNTEKRHLLRLQHAKTEDGVHRFTYNYYVPPNSQVTIEARPKTKLSAEAEQFVQNLLFNPTQIKLNVDETCILNAEEAQLEIRQGLIYVGSVQPAIKDWTLSVYYEDVPEGKDALFETTHKNDATFKLGPYLDTHKYDIRAEKEGYKLDPTYTQEGYNLIRVTFAAQKLSHLKIKVVDEQKKPVPGALLFVSSMSKKNQIKINNYTNENGVFSTYHLVKGEYFVKAVLKEYSFNPPQTTISIDDGEQKEITVVATRVAYSVFGKVQKLNKAGCEGLKVTAIPQDPHVQSETAETDASGNFRIKGLIPGKVYEIVPSTEQGSQFAVIRPGKTTIVAKPQDILNVDFIGFERKNGTTLYGNVQFDGTYKEEDLDQIETIQVRLFRAGENEPVRTANVKLFRYFEFNDVQPDNYAIRTLIKRGKNSQPSEHTQYVALSQFGEEHRLPVNVHISKEKSKSAREALAQGTYMAPILFLIVIFVVLNLDTLKAKYNRYVSNKQPYKRKTL